MPKRWCSDCRALFDLDATGTLRCPACETKAATWQQEGRRAYQRTRPSRGTPTQRGYGTSYRRARQALLAAATQCHWCGAEFTPANRPTADHDPPLARGGDHTRMVAACARCNSRRGGKTRR